MLDDPCQSLHPSKERGLNFLECDTVEEACQALGEGICVVKLLNRK
jgi:hypothetical protein